MPARPISVRWPPWSKSEKTLGPPRMASIHSSIWPLERGMDSGMALAAAWAPNHEKRASSFMRMAPSEFQRPHWS